MSKPLRAAWVNGIAHYLADERVRMTNEQYSNVIGSFVDAFETLATSTGDTFNSEVFQKDCLKR